MKFLPGTSIFSANTVTLYWRLSQWPMHIKGWSSRICKQKLYSLLSLYSTFKKGWSCRCGIIYLQLARRTNNIVLDLLTKIIVHFYIDITFRFLK